MSTNSIIAVPVIPGDIVWKGRYAHWDGYPTHMGKQLWAIIKRDGLDVARKTLTEVNTEWSGINAFTVLTINGEDLVIPGYGLTYKDASTEWWFSTKTNEWKGMFVYVLEDEGMRIINRIGLFYPWSGDEPDWGEIEGLVS